MSSGFSGEIIIRYRGFGHGGPIVKGIKLNRLRSEVSRLNDQGWRLDDLSFHEYLATPLLTYTISGQIMRTERGYELFYSIENAPAHDSLKKGKSENGLKPLEILRHVLWPEDFSDLMEFLDNYPDQVVEFSSFEQRVGILGRHMIIWEIRHY